MSSYLDVEVNHSNKYYLSEELKYDCCICDCNHTFDATIYLLANVYENQVMLILVTVLGEQLLIYDIVILPCILLNWHIV